MATQKQLNALKKARAARATNATNKTAKKKPRKPPVKRATRSDFYTIVKVHTVNGDGFFTGWSKSGPTFDTLESKAEKMNDNTADIVMNAIFSSKINGIKKVESIKKKV